MATELQLKFVWQKIHLIYFQKKWIAIPLKVKNNNNNNNIYINMTITKNTVNVVVNFVKF